MKLSTKSLMPPNLPWKELGNGNWRGVISYYYSDSMSCVPVRWVTKPNDNKSDPNLETMTYGLFSTCSQKMREGIVRNRIPHIFFVTNFNGERLLTGYYHIKWYAVGSLGPKDFCLAATNIKFLEKPISLRQIDKLNKTNISKFFRLFRYLKPKECEKLLKLITRSSDATGLYLSEIDRLERFNKYHTGYRYVGWRLKNKFSWDYAKSKKYLSSRTPTQSTSGSNASVTGWWKCTKCHAKSRNKALLKVCPICGFQNTLVPLE